MKNQHAKDYSLLREVPAKDLVPGKTYLLSSDEIVVEYVGRLVASSQYPANHILRVPGGAPATLWGTPLHQSLYEIPLGWVEGRPVYPGDVLFPKLCQEPSFGWAVYMKGWDKTVGKLLGMYIPRDTEIEERRARGASWELSTRLIHFSEDSLTWTDPLWKRKWKEKLEATYNDAQDSSAKRFAYGWVIAYSSGSPGAPEPLIPAIFDSKKAAQRYAEREAFPNFRLIPWNTLTPPKRSY